MQIAEGLKLILILWMIGFGYSRSNCRLQEKKYANLRHVLPVFYCRMKSSNYYYFFLLKYSLSITGKSWLVPAAMLYWLQVIKKMRTAEKQIIHFDFEWFICLIVKLWWIRIGGSGFLGQHIIKHLQEKDDDVKEIRVVDLKPYRNKLSAWKIHIP